MEEKADINRSINLIDENEEKIIVNEHYPHNIENQQNRKSTIPKKETLVSGWNACCMTSIHLFLIAALGLAIGLTFSTSRNAALRVAITVISSIIILFLFIMVCGCKTLSPNEGIVLVLWGRYIGTLKSNGCFWILPFIKTLRVSYKSQNFESHVLKVNDKRGNPVEVSAVVTWKVYDSYSATFDIEDLTKFVNTQSESAIRYLISRYSFDKFNENEISLKDGGDEIHEELVNTLQTYLNRAGVQVEEAKFNHMTYAPEVTQVMLKRQQAESIIGARRKIIEGAMGIIGSAVESLEKNNITEMSRKDKVRLVSNLLVVMCSESHGNSLNITSSATKIEKKTTKAIGFNPFSNPILSAEEQFAKGLYSLLSS